MNAQKKAAVAVACGIAVFGLGSCSIDLFGYFFSESSPDLRFSNSSGQVTSKYMVPEVAENFSFLFVTDLHIETAKHTYLEGLKSRIDDAEFVIFGGDLTQNGRREDFVFFKAKSDALGVPYYQVLGNHDVYSGGWQAAMDILGPSTYSVKLGNDARLICLDTANGTLGIKQYTWLREELEKTTESFIIVASHVQFFTNNFMETQQFTFPEESAQLFRLFDQYGVDLVLAGHSHSYDYKKIGQTGHYVSDPYLDGSTDASYLYIQKKSDGTCEVTRRNY